MPIILLMTSLVVSQPIVFKTVRSNAMISLSVFILHMLLKLPGVMSNMPKMRYDMEKTCTFLDQNSVLEDCLVSFNLKLAKYEGSVYFVVKTTLEAASVRKRRKAEKNCVKLRSDRKAPKLFNPVFLLTLRPFFGQKRRWYYSFHYKIAVPILLNFSKL